MSQQQRDFLAYLGFFVLIIWAGLILVLLVTWMRQPQEPVVEAISEIVETPTVTRAALPTSTSTPLRTPTPTLTPQLPALYVDGPFIRRSDTHQTVWLKGANVEEFRQPNPHTLVDLLNVQGLDRVVQQKWGVNLLRVAVDPETVESNLAEFGKVIAFAQEHGMYVLFVPFASAVNPARDEAAMPVPDALVATTMGYLADQFKDQTNVLYGIWNEPHPDSIPSLGYDKQWQTWMNAGIAVAQSIRNQNPKALLVGPAGNKWARDMTYYKTHPFPFDNIIYDVHDYWAYPAYDYSRTMWTWAIGKYPILIGEFGGDPTKPSDNAGINYMLETFRIINQNPAMVHYAMYALTNDGVWGIFTHTRVNMPKGNLLQADLSAYPPTRFR